MKTNELKRKDTHRILMGNEAIGRGLVEAGVTLAASYPGTPASEILQAVVVHAKETGAALHAEWSVNEKVAYETALANAMAGRRAAVSMKQVGLNVASDPFMRSAYLGVKGGFLVISADDPGPHSSQTEQDSRFFAMFAKIPVLDPASPREAKDMVRPALELSEQYELPVMLRPTTRVCHARQNILLASPQPLERPAHFEKNMRRWCATPQYLRELHRELNEKITKIAADPEFYPRLTAGDGSQPGACIIASGVAFAHTWDLLDELGLLGKIDFFQVTMPYPLNREFSRRVKADYEKILVIEETYPVIELQLANGAIQGRREGMVPNQGELTPDVIRPILEKFLELPPSAAPDAPQGDATRPTLCAGCAHRAAFYAIRETFPEGIFPGDIGCYTLGMNLGAVDSCHCMGAGLSQAAGFYHAYAASGPVPTIVATIGDSTFFHAGLPALINAVFHGARIILVILDNSTTAMTGHQPTPQAGLTASGAPAQAVSIPELVRACGVGFLAEHDPYELLGFMEVLKEADHYCRGETGGPAVVIAKHACMLDRAARKSQAVYGMCVTDCVGCLYCLENFECPALTLDEASGQVEIDGVRCVGCGVCVHVCPAGAIEARPRP